MAYYKSKKQALAKAVKDRESRIEVYEKAAKDKAEGRLTDSQKMLIGCATVAVVLGTAYAINRHGIKEAEYKAFMEAERKRWAESEKAGEELARKYGKPGETIRFNDFMKRWDNTQYSLFNAVSEDAFDHLSTDDIRIDAGNILKRVSKSDGSIIRGATQYVSFTEEDVNRYKAILPTKFWPRWNNSIAPGEGFVVSYQAVHDIVSPSAKKRVEAFIDLMGDTIPNPNSEDVKTGRDYVFSLISRNIEALQNASTDGNVDELLYSNRPLSNEELGRRAYQLFATLELTDKNSPLSNAYIEKIKAMGYNALVDDNDAGRLSDMPLIILDAADNLSWMGADELTVAKINRAGRSLKELLERKNE